MTELLLWAHSRSWSQVLAWCALINLAVFVGALGLGACVTRALARQLDVPPVTRAEQLLAAACVLGNLLVMFVGWRLFQAGLLTIEAGVGFWRTLGDALILTLVMDVAMFVTHRMAHLPFVYRYIHAVHHRHLRVRPLSLFVLHPLEVLAFGGLWICVLSCHAFCVEGMLLYLTLNTVFGITGHLGFEPLPTRFRTLPLLRHLGSSSFHARHHENPNVNFGFYTTFWDRLFGSLDRLSGRR